MINGDADWGVKTGFLSVQALFCLYLKLLLTWSCELVSLALALSLWLFVGLSCPRSLVGLRLRLMRCMMGSLACAVLVVLILQQVREESWVAQV